MDLKKHLTQMMKNRGLSRAGLAYALGYKSANSIARIMDGTCGRESAGEFLQRMLSCEPLALTQEERMELLSCMDSRDLGEENEGLYNAFGYLLENTYHTQGNTALREAFRAQDMMGRKDCRRVNIVLFNCVNEDFIWEVRRVQERVKIPITMDHYILEPQSAAEAPGMIKSILPLLHTPGYRCLAVTVPDRAYRKGILGADAALMTFEYADGTEKQFLTFLYGEKEEMTVPLTKHIDAKELVGTVGSIRQINGEGLPRPNEGLERYMAFCCSLERGHAVYQIKPCFGMEQVPAEIIIRAGLDGEGRVPEYLKGLIPLLNKREKNLLGKKRPQYHVFKQAEMARFVRTGQMADHPALLRPFTPPERVEILIRLEERLNRNPYFHLLFFKEEDVWLDDEVTLYEDAGLSIIKPGTDYDPAGTHNESLLVGPQDFLEAYKAFYLNRLIRTRCRSGRESAAILHMLIGEAQKLCSHSN